MKSKLTDLTTFTGNDGDMPSGPVIADASGDLYGVTYTGGANGDGTVYELVNTPTGYASTPTTLVNFGPGGGIDPIGTLVTDSNGDLFGTTKMGGADGGGTLFEIANTSSGYAAAPVTLTSFAPTDNLAGDLVMDSAGDLFGTTLNGGAFGDGSEFELANTATGYASTPTTLFSFEGTTSLVPTGDLMIDSKGDLFTTSFWGGANDAGAVLEFVNTPTGFASAPTVIASFDSTDGWGPVAGLVMDANGDLFGMTNAGGSTGYNDGVVFEIVNTPTGYDSTPLDLANFTSYAGRDGSLTIDANGDLFGVAGEVFELANTSTGYAQHMTYIAGFTGTNGDGPTGSLVTDANGDLISTTSVGGTTGDGTVFEVSGSGFVPPEGALSIIDAIPEQPTYDFRAMDPFQRILITDSGENETETVTITLSNAANGALVDPNAATDGSTDVDGVYTVTGSAAAVTADVNALSFVPTRREVPFGDSVTTNFIITATDSSGQTDTNGVSSVIATYAAPGGAVASFDRADGQHPDPGLVIDANGNLLGMTAYDTVFEIANTSTGLASTPVTLVHFPSYAEWVVGSLTTDPNGDLFGTEFFVGPGENGIVFEIAKTPTGYASSPTIVSHFNWTDGAGPDGTLLYGPNGDLFGIDSRGGALDGGTVYEIVNTPTGYLHTAIPLASFPAYASPIGTMVMDSSGDLFGVATLGTEGGNGAIFEIVNTPTGYAHVPVTVATFDGADGQFPAGGLVADSSGNLFGVTSSGGADNHGVVFEVENTATGYASTPVTLTSFNLANGANPQGALLMDANGDLFGTTAAGGADNEGTVFEIVNTGEGYASAPVTVFTFDGANGALPNGSLAANAEGDLFGTSDDGGGSNAGAVFEVANSGYMTTKMQFIDSIAAGETLVATPGTPDEFVFINPAPGLHTIAGFDTTQDLIELSDTSFSSPAAVQSAVTPTADGALLDLGDGASLLVSGVSVSALQARNFTLG